MNWLDPIGAGLSLICTYYFTKAHRFAWLIGLVAISLNIILYWQRGIYGYILLESIYFISMIYGWYQWHNPLSGHLHRPIRYLTLTQGLLILGAALLSIGGLAQILILTHSDILYWDAITTVLSLIAQFLLCFKIIHCWFLWFVVDAMVGALQFYKGIPFHSAIHGLYLFFAVLGYYRWRKLYQQQNSSPTLLALT